MSAVTRPGPTARPDHPSAKPDAPKRAAATDSLTAEERAAIQQVLSAEYGVLAGSLAAVWSASLVRTSLFLGVLSAVGVALGFAAQAEGGFGGAFNLFALVALPLALFLGLATFARTIEVQREAIVYIVGMNRIRHFMSEAVPGSRPYLVLSTHDDELGVYRSQGTGIRLRRPRHRLVFALVQTQGIVGVMCAALAAVIAGLVGALMDQWLGWAAGAIAFTGTLILLLAYWQRSVAEVRDAIRPLHPTLADGTESTI